MSTDENDWRAQGYALPPNEFSPEPEKPVPTGLQKLPRTWAYLTRAARPADSGTATLDAFGNPLEPTDAAPSKPAPGKTQDGERSAFSGDWGDGDGPTSSGDAVDFDAADVFNTLPPDIHLSHHGEAIVTSLAGHMGPKGMSVSQIHAALAWARDSSGSEDDDTAMFERFALHMSQHGMTRTQADQVKIWAQAYVSSEDYDDDMAVAECEAALAAIKSKMGSQEYTKDETMQENYRILLDVLGGE